MNATEHLLVCLGEEASEIVKDAAKALRFGVDDRFRSDGPMNVERLVAELNDLLAVVELLVRARVLPWDWENREDQRLKIVKVEEFMKYARLRKALV